MSFAECLGRRLKVFPELVTLLEQLALDGNGSVTRSVLRGLKGIAGIFPRSGSMAFSGYGSVPVSALRILKNHARSSFTRLVPKLVASDPSWMTQPDIYNFVHRRRQDLLTPFLGRQTYRGRFSTGRTRMVLPLTSGFHRWSPSQQQKFCATLEEITRDEQRDSPALLQYVL